MLKKFLKHLSILLLITVFVLPAFCQKAEKDRADFKLLMKRNPNYFGTIPGSKFKAVKMMMQNKKYEELRCIGFHPETNLLESIINVKLSYGYGGSLCSPGSHEYVRFFIDWNGDGDYKDTGEDAGLVNVNVHSIPSQKAICLSNTKPLSYSISLEVNPKKYSCPNPYLVKVKAILSWNVAPTAGNPDYVPVWGNVVEKWIQIKPLLVYIAKHALKVVDVKKYKVEPSKLAMMPYPKMKMLKPTELKVMYKEKKVPELRYNFSKIHEVAMKIKKQPSLKTKYKADSKLSKIVDLTKFVVAPKKNVTYEELKCVGLNYNQSKLEATLNIKRPYGYCGELCKSGGSYEYVGFWAYVKTQMLKKKRVRSLKPMGACYWKYLGTAKVNVHDIKTLPAGGLQYAVSLPVDFSSYRKKCTYPVVIKIRAILSWNKKPTNSNYNTVWGNRIETQIQIRPGEYIPPGTQKAFIWSVARMAVESIGGNPYTTLPSSIGPGYADGPCTGPGGYTAIKSPFGGKMTISGCITHAPINPLTDNKKLKYKLQFRKYDKFANLPWRDITNQTNKFKIWIRIDGVPSGYIWQKPDKDGYYLYQKDIYGTKKVEVQDDVLGYWQTPVSEGDGLYEIRMVFKKPTSSLVIPSEAIKIMVDNTAPTADIILNAGACTLFTINSIITGKFTATDSHFWTYRIRLHPYAPSPTSLFAHTPKIPGPTYIYHVDPTYPTLAVPGASNGEFKFNTKNMKQCGYVFYLHVWDRTIRNDHMPGNRAGDSVGFCLLNR